MMSIFQAFNGHKNMLTVNIYMLEKVPNIIVAASVDHGVPEWRVGEGHGDGPLLPGAAAVLAPVHRPRPAAHSAGPAD